MNLIRFKPCIALQASGVEGYDGGVRRKIIVLYQVKKAEEHFRGIDEIKIKPLFGFEQFFKRK